MSPLRSVIIGAAVAVLAAGTAWAVSATGNQNPQLLVRVTLNPRHARVGDTVVGRATVTNTTSHAIKNVEFDTTFETTTQGQGTAAVGALAAGSTWTEPFRLKVKAGTPSGTDKLTASAQDASGTSHAGVSGRIR